VILAVLVLAAAPQFETSTIAASRATIRPLETIDYTITIRNTGDRAPSYLRVANAIPTSAMFAGASPDFKFIEADRELSWLGTIEPGTAKVLTFSLVTRPESSGLTLANRTAIHFDGHYHGLDHDLPIETPPRTNRTTELVVFGYLGAALLILLMFRRGAVVLVLISIGFLLFFVDLARRDSRIRNKYVETQCTVVDSMARFAESQTASATAPSRRTGTWTPLFAVRYPTTAGEMVSVGYASPSHIQIGRRRAESPSLQMVTRGATAPCWYDPENPKQLVLVRDFGGAYWFALLPLTTLLFALRFRSPRGTPRDSEEPRGTDLRRPRPH